MKGSIQRLQLLILGVSDGHCQYQIFWSGHWVGKKIVTPMVAECQSGDNIGQNVPVSQQHNSRHYNTNTEEKYFYKLEVKLHNFFSKWTQPSYSEILFQFRTFKRKTLLWVKTWKFVSSNPQQFRTAEMSFLHNGIIFVFSSKY